MKINTKFHTSLRKEGFVKNHIPPGIYRACCIEHKRLDKYPVGISRKKSKRGNFYLVEFTFVILDRGEHFGKRVYDSIAIKEESKVFWKALYSAVEPIWEDRENMVFDISDDRDVHYHFLYKPFYITVYENRWTTDAGRTLFRMRAKEYRGIHDGAKYTEAVTSMNYLLSQGSIGRGQIPEFHPDHPSRVKYPAQTILEE